MNGKLFKVILRTYYMAGPILHVGDTDVSEIDRVPVLMELMTWSGWGSSQLTTADGTGKKDIRAMGQRWDAG